MWWKKYTEEIPKDYNFYTSHDVNMLEDPEDKLRSELCDAECISALFEEACESGKMSWMERMLAHPNCSEETFGKIVNYFFEHEVSPSYGCTNRDFVKFILKNQYGMIPYLTN